MEQMEKNKLLERAGQHIFHTPPADVGAELCLENMKYGLAKIHSVQEQLSTKPDATFLASPDVTITINSYRWNSGFGYGGKLSWGDDNEDLIFLDTKPNCCGMFVGGLDKLPEKETLMRRSIKMKREQCTVDGVKIKWNLEKGNHFVDVFEVRTLSSGLNLPPFAFMAHTSGSELKKETILGPGLYVDSSKTIGEWAEEFQTPFGKMNILTGSKAREYYQFYEIAEAFAQNRRLRAAELLFEDFSVITNANHQGLLNRNEIALGINAWQGPPDGTLFPLALRPDLPAYLFEGLPNYSSSTIASLGWEKRAHDLGVYHRLENANMLPHGAGYNFPLFRKVLRVHEVENRRLFEVGSKSGESSEIFSDLRNVPYEYRGKEVFTQSVELGLGKPVAELLPVYVLKI